MVVGRRTVDVEQTLIRFPLLAGARGVWRPLAGGLSHHVYLVELAGGPAGEGSAGPPRRYVLRVLDPAVCAVGLGIECAHEVANTRLAAGIGPAVLGVLDDIPAVLLEYIPGQTLSAADIPSRLAAVAAACRRLHAGPHFVTGFDIRTKRTELLALCQRHGLPLPDGYRDADDALAAIGTTLCRRPLPVLPCHNDLLAENFIEQPDGTLRIVDYQLSGDNDPTFELGDIAAEADLDPDQTQVLANAYFGGEASAGLLARTRLQAILANATWALWFVVYDALLRPAGGSFDYRAEADDKWRQARRDLAAADFGGLLAAAAGQRTAPASAHRVTRDPFDAKEAP